jgi:hypothetical protein
MGLNRPILAMEPASKPNPALKDLIRDLLAQATRAFPLTCPRCATTYASYGDYVRFTSPVADSSGAGKNPPVKGRHLPVVGLFRDCPCGESLCAVFPDRRDASDTGSRRRDVFGQMVEMLKSSGLSTESARQEVINLMQGDNSDVSSLFF